MFFILAEKFLCIDIIQNVINIFLSFSVTFADKEDTSDEVRTGIFLYTINN